MRSQSNAENDVLKRINQCEKLEDIIPKKASKNVRQTNIKPLMLILAHMFKLKEADDALVAESMDYIRKMAP